MKRNFIRTTYRNGTDEYEIPKSGFVDAFMAGARARKRDDAIRKIIEERQKRLYEIFDRYSPPPECVVFDYSNYIMPLKLPDGLRKYFNNLNTKQMKKIIIDNKEIEISEESYEAFKKQFIKGKHVDRWEDLEKIDGLYVNTYSEIMDIYGVTKEHLKNTFKTRKQALSSLAMAQLSQLMDEYESTKNVDWENSKQMKYFICRINDKILKDSDSCLYYFLSFTSREERNEFYDKHLDLIKQYYML